MLPAHCRHLFSDVFLMLLQFSLQNLQSAWDTRNLEMKREGRKGGRERVALLLKGMRHYENYETETECVFLHGGGGQMAIFINFSPLTKKITKITVLHVSWEFFLRKNLWKYRSLCLDGGIGEVVQDHCSRGGLRWAVLTGERTVERKHVYSRLLPGRGGERERFGSHIIVIKSDSWQIYIHALDAWRPLRDSVLSAARKLREGPEGF